MKAIIQSRLVEITQTRNITLLYACESGSRGWGFPSPDSDYDVRFIYLRPTADYLRISPAADHMTFPISSELDIYGWDLRKVLALIGRSNTTPFEWLQSPVVYSGDERFRSGLWSLCRHYFSQRSNVHHYLGIAKGALDAANGDRIGIKKLFYVLRPLLAARWCLARESIAPMAIGPLMTLLQDNLQEKIRELIRLKAGAPEGREITIDPELRAYIAAEYAACSEAARDLPRNTFDREALDAFFYKTITAHDDTGFKR